MQRRQGGESLVLCRDVGGVYCAYSTAKKREQNGQKELAQPPVAEGGGSPQSASRPLKRAKECESSFMTTNVYCVCPLRQLFLSGGDYRNTSL